jgi:hypothetical protein
MTASAVFLGPLVFDAVRGGAMLDAVMFLAASVPVALMIVAPVVLAPFLLVRRLLLSRPPVRCAAAIGAGAAVGAAITCVLAWLVLGNRSAWDIRDLTLLGALAGGSGGGVYWRMVWRQGPVAPTGAA